MQKINDFLLGAYIKMQAAANSFMKKENGEANIIAIILVLVIVISIVIIFRQQLQNIVTNIWNNINENVSNANQNITYG